MSVVHLYAIVGGFLFVVALGALAYGGLRLWWLAQPKPLLRELTGGGEVEQQLERWWASEREIARKLEPHKAHLREYEARLELLEKAKHLRRREYALRFRSGASSPSINAIVVEEETRLRRHIAEIVERTH